MAAPVTLNGDQLGRALAAADDANARAVRTRARKASNEHRVDVFVDLHAAGAVGQCEDAIVGRALAVNGDRVERVATTRLGRRAATAAGSTAASVVRKPSIVAMRGSIMPEPLAMPPTRNGADSVVTSTAHSFGNGSVVMIARAASRAAARRPVRPPPARSRA